MNERFMREALHLAKEAASEGEVPVGAVIVVGDNVVGRGRNRRICMHDATAHAEIEAIRDAGNNLGVWNLSGAEMYVTLEPCVMCAGAIVNSRISKLYFGAYDKRFGCAGTLCNLASDDRFNHRAEVVGGVLGDECSELLSDFFKKIRVSK